MLPPSVILSGDVREDAQGLLFELGRGMSAALAQNVLRMGLPLARGRAVMDGLRAAFGAPPESGRPVDSSTAQWAESFWQVVPARTQRRMQQLLSRDSLLEYGELVARAHHSGFRVGMFLSGDFAYATRTLLAESTESLEAPSRQSLRRLCLKLPALADLFRLAVSPEYATARWHSSGPLTSRGPFSVGKFNLS
jgi:hypothetical protein